MLLSLRHPLTLDNVQRAAATFINRALGDELFRACLGLGGVLPASFEPGVLEDLLQAWRGGVDRRFDILFVGHSVAPLNAYVRLAGARAPSPTPAISLRHPYDDDGDEEVFRLLGYLCSAAGVAPQVGDGRYLHTSAFLRPEDESESGFDFQGEWGNEGSNGEGSDDELREVFIHPCASDEAEDGSSSDE